MVPPGIRGRYLATDSGVNNLASFISFLVSAVCLGSQPQSWRFAVIFAFSALMGAASLAYWPKPVRELTEPEALNLAVIPQNPRKRLRAAAPEARTRLAALWQAAHPGDARLTSEAALALPYQPLSSLPFAVMAIVQLLYWSSGGKIGEPGVQGLLTDFQQVKTLEPTVQALLISFTSRLTIFWLWSLMLVYFGARFALGGWRIVAFLVVIAWALIQIGAPVITGTITAQTAEDTPIVEDGMGGEFQYASDQVEFIRAETVDAFRIELD